jgi:hypothetical protein
VRSQFVYRRQGERGTVFVLGGSFLEKTQKGRLRLALNDMHSQVCRIERGWVDRIAPVAGSRVASARGDYSSRLRELICASTAAEGQVVSCPVVGQEPH